MNNNYQFDLLSFIFLTIVIIFSTVYFFYKRAEIKPSYIGSLFVVSCGIIFISIGFVRIVDKIPDWDIKLLFDYLLFRNPDIFKRARYFRSVGYFFTVVGIEFLFITIAKKRKHPSN
jgi:hypothetical protein